METCQQQEAEGPKVVVVEDNFISGPPASRSVIDNLKKLLTQRQHSRESDSENKNAVLRSTSGSNSDAAFYSHLSSSTSDSDDSDPILILDDITTPARKPNPNNHNRRRLRRHRSASSSSTSSSSPSQVQKRRRKTVCKVARLKLTFTPVEETGRIAKLVDNTNTTNSTTVTDSAGQTISGSASTNAERATSSKKSSSASPTAENSTSSHKDSSSDDENTHRLDPSHPHPYHRLKSRRDRNQKRKRSENTIYANQLHRPKILKTSGTLTQIPVILISPSTDSPTPTTATIQTFMNQSVETANPTSIGTGEQLALSPLYAEPEANK